MHIISRSIYRIILLTHLLLFFHPTETFPQIPNTWTSPLNECRKYLTAEMTTIKLASDNNKTIYLPKLNGVIEAIDIYDGSKKWTTETGGNFTGELLPYKNSLYAVTKVKVVGSKEIMDGLFNENSFINHIQKNDGLVLNKISFKYKDIKYLQNFPDRHILFTDNGTIESKDANWNTVWIRSLDTRITTEPVFFSNPGGKQFIILGTSNKTLIILSAADGKVSEQIYTKNIPHFLMYEEGRIYMGDYEGLIFSMAVNRKKTFWKTYTGGKITGISVLENGVLVSSDDNFMYLLSKNNGNKIWRINLGGRIIGKTFLNEKTVLVLVSGTDTAIIFDLENGRPINRISLSDDIYFVSPPLKLNDLLVLPTQKGLYIYSSVCKKGVSGKGVI